MFGWSYPAGCNSTPYDDNLPDNCPVCKGENYDLDREQWIFESGPYCCAKCAEKGAEADRLAAEDEAAEWREIEQNEAKWEAQLRALPVDHE